MMLLPSVCEQRPKRLLLLVNPISGGRHGVSNLKKIQPLFELAGITCDVKGEMTDKTLIYLVCNKLTNSERVITNYHM